MTEKKQRIILRILLIFILVQPVLDVLSRLAILDIIPNISTYVKPLFVFGLAIYLLFKYSPFKRKWIIYVVLFALFTVGHLYLLYQLLLGKDIILHEFRFIINIAYMIAMCFDLFTIYYWSSDKKRMLRELKYTLVITFGIYLVLYFLSIITGTSGRTYEYADKYKKGFKGWFDSGQILGHAFSTCFPVILYVILKPSRFRIIRFLYLALAILFVSLLGTKVPYFIVLIVLVCYVILLLFFKFFHKNIGAVSRFNIAIACLGVIVMLVTYQYTPVAYNTDINNKNAAIEAEMYDLSKESGKKDIDYDKIIKDNPDKDLSYVKKYRNWGKEASKYLENQFYAHKVHPSDTRAKQLVYSAYKYKIADVQYKLLGLGFLNQDASFALERDFFMAILNFGIFGFILFLIIPIWIFGKCIKFIFTKFKKLDLEFAMLFMGLGIFFCISIYAGYTYIYTNFSIFLAVIMTMLLLKMDTISNEKKEKISDVKFLSLHLGYGGIESATINSANALSKDYNVEIVAFYKLKNSQDNKLNKNVKVKFLYDGEPNRKEFKEFLHNKKIIKAFKEGIKALKILILKRILMIKEIKNTKKGAIVSTRVEISTLLSKYGNVETLNIAQEHCYHNNNKKYIRKIKEKYLGIDYLCALTTTLYDDYKKFLKFNNHTKVVLLPNMLSELSLEHSSLSKPNLITVSRLDYGKRNNEIIDNFSKIKNKKAQLYIIGDGAECEALKKQIADLKLEKRVHMLGYLNQDEIKKHMLDSSCFLMASVTEGLPMVLLEAMSYGVPCIVYKTASGTGDIVKDGINGFIIENRDSKMFIKDVDKILMDDDLRRKMGKEAVKTSEKFSKKEVVKIWNKMLKENL